MLDEQLMSTCSFPSCSGAGRGLRERFSRLTQICAVLNVDKAEDALDLVDGGIGPSRLTSAEVAVVLELREDLGEEAEVRRVVRQLRGSKGPSR
jgi:hypothetical protein